MGSDRSDLSMRGVMPKNYYLILGVPRYAGTAEIKRAYRQLARTYHPDTSAATGDSERFREISEAYQTLVDPEARRVYNQSLDRMESPGRPVRVTVSTEPIASNEADDLFLEMDAWLDRWVSRFFGPDPISAASHFSQKPGAMELATFYEPEEPAIIFKTVGKQPCRACDGRSQHPAHICLVCFGKGV